MNIACCVQAARDSPTPARRIVQFRAREDVGRGETGAIMSPGNKDHAVGQQCRCVKSACGVETADDSPGPARRIVKFRARKSNEGVIKSRCN